MATICIAYPEMFHCYSWNIVVHESLVHFYRTALDYKFYIECVRQRKMIPHTLVLDDHIVDFVLIYRHRMIANTLSNRPNYPIHR